MKYHEVIFIHCRPFEYGLNLMRILLLAGSFAHRISTR